MKKEINGKESKTEIISNDTMESISNSINQFSLDLSNELGSSERNKNIAISPLSISTALALVLLGSKRHTAAQIEKVLHIPESQMPLKDERSLFGKLCGRKLKKEEVVGAISSVSLDSKKKDRSVPIDSTTPGSSIKLSLNLQHYEFFEVPDVHHRFHELLNQLKSQKSNSVLTIASAAFTQLNFPILEEYLRNAETLYETKLDTVDFQDDKTRKEINSWVEEKTEGKIKDLFQENSLDKSASLVLVNAVYFKGQWKKKFKEENTRTAPFYITKDTQISVPMMSQKMERFNIGIIEEIDAEIIELPYGTGDLCMFIILPNEVAGLQKIEEQITAESLMKWTSSTFLISSKVELQIPRFKIETSYDLAKSLTNMGMVDAFSQQKADLSGISDIGLYVSQVIHKCFIDVNEEGTEAAAATGVAIMPKSLLPPKTFIVDHPFLCFIKHIATNTILFHVKIYCP